MSEKPKPREWWMVRGPPPMNQLFVYLREVIARQAALPHNGEIFHVREVLPEEVTDGKG